MQGRCAQRKHHSQESDQLIAESRLMRKRVKERLTTTENEELFPSEVHGARAASGEEG